MSYLYVISLYFFKYLLCDFHALNPSNLENFGLSNCQSNLEIYSNLI